jgi:hypothetical protein
MAPVPGRTLSRPAKVDTGFAIGSTLRPQGPKLRMANGWALGQFGGELGRRTLLSGFLAAVRITCRS